jgi:hypothetical protein
MKVLSSTPASPVVAESARVGNAVLDRVAVRVQQRLAAEKAADGRLAEGGHAASIAAHR